MARKEVCLNVYELLAQTCHFHPVMYEGVVCFSMLTVYIDYKIKQVCSTWNVGKFQNIVKYASNSLLHDWAKSENEKKQRFAITLVSCKR